jgi:hypothetical protein
MVTTVCACGCVVLSCLLDLALQAYAGQLPLAVAQPEFAKPVGNVRSVQSGRSSTVGQLYRTQLRIRSEKGCYAVHCLLTPFSRSIRGNIVKPG